MSDSYYRATVYGTGRFWFPYRGEVTCMHPNGFTTHYEHSFPFFWMAQWVTTVIAKGKKHQHTAYWSKDFKENI